MNLAEKYRPKTLSEVIGQEKAVNSLQALVERRALGGRAFYIVGKSGTGKTTLARILANSIADRLYVKEVVARNLRPSELKQWADSLSYSTLFGAGGHALIVNESHGLAKDTIEVFLDLLENLPAKAIVIFTTTLDGLDLFEDMKIDASPFRSRCLFIKLTDQGLADKFAARAKEVAMAENLDGKPLPAYKRLLQDCGNNLREAYNRIEAGDMRG